MSNDVVISKELRDKLIEELEYHEPHAMASEINQLRAAPETVSLEGVERMKLYQWLNSQEDGETELVRVSDLRRLITPVHGGDVELELLKRFKDFVVETILPNARNVSLDVVEELAWSSIVQEVDAHLTSRTEGK